MIISFVNISNRVIDFPKEEFFAPPMLSVPQHLKLSPFLHLRNSEPKQLSISATQHPLRVVLPQFLRLPRFHRVKTNNWILSTLACHLINLLAHAAQSPIEIPLWADGLPGGASVQLEESWTERPVEDGGSVELDRSVKDISTPTITVYLPAQPNEQRTSIVILPGGGFGHLAIDKEGHDIARWLNSHGIAGIVVKYRVVHEASNFHVYNACLPDSLRAIRLLRQNADAWNLDPDKVGVMGFSAGGYLTAAAGTLYDGGDASASDSLERMSCKPNFIAPIYPLIELDERLATTSSFKQRMFGPEASSDLVKQFSPLNHVSSSTPPTFLVHAHDDNLSTQSSVRFYQALLEAGVSAEIHIYSQGGHGYGIRQRGLPISAWRDRFLDWMQLHGFHK
jgi:acetyl esterase/lipase